MAGSDAPQQRQRRPWPFWLQILVAIVVVALIQGFVVKPFRVPSESMEQTLLVGDRIAALRLDTTPSRQDVIIFGHGDDWTTDHTPTDPNLAKAIGKKIGDLTGIGPSNTQYTVKRVIGLPGEKVKCCDAAGHVTVDGTPLEEPYVYSDLPFEPGTIDCTSAVVSRRCFPEITVPADSYLVMGDHRDDSDDSVLPCRGGTSLRDSCARFVRHSQITGRVMTRIWPLNRLGGL